MEFEGMIKGDFLRWGAVTSEELGEVVHKGTGLRRAAVVAFESANSMAFKLGLKLPGPAGAITGNCNTAADSDVWKGDGLLVYVEWYYT
jgi:hypothetical protein